MAGTWAKIQAGGYLGKDPEMQYQQDGTARTKFSIANKRKGQNGSDVSDWYNVTCWGKIAEAVASNLHKGSYVMVEGRFSSDLWQDNQGNWRISNNINAGEVKFLDKIGGGNQGGGGYEDTDF